MTDIRDLPAVRIGKLRMTTDAAKVLIGASPEDQQRPTRTDLYLKPQHDWLRGMVELIIQTAGLDFDEDVELVLDWIFPAEPPAPEPKEKK